MLTEFLSKSQTQDGETFQQYTYRHVCMKLRPGQDHLFGIHLLNDYPRVRQILQSVSGPDFIASQLTQVGEQWITQKTVPPTWGEFLSALEREPTMNQARRNITQKLADHSIGTFVK